MRGITFLAQKLGQIFLILFWPFKKAWPLIFKYLFIPLYNLLRLIKKRVKLNFGQSVENKITPLITHKYFLYFLIFIFSLTILSNNFHIKSAAAEDLGKQSLLYKISQGDRYEEIIEEVSLIPDDYQTNDSLAQEQAANDDFLEPQEMALTKSESSNLELADTALTDTTVAEGLAADTLQKSSQPATLSAPKPRNAIQEYVVESGDTLSDIAEKFSVSINTLLWANDLSGLSIIRPGDKLTILPVTGVLHKIKSGDTISALAKKYNVEQDKILSYNQLISDDQLQINQILIIPGGEIQYSYARATPSVANIFKSPSGERRAGGFIWPTVSRQITQYYHWRHLAIDIGGKTGQAVYAALQGRVTKAGWSTGYGYHVIIDHGGGRKTLYAHLSRIYVERSQQVTQGAAIGAIGSTGWSTGPHLHFEININGTKVNPLSYL